MTSFSPIQTVTEQRRKVSDEMSALRRNDRGCGKQGNMVTSYRASNGIIDPSSTTDLSVAKGFAVTLGFFFVKQSVSQLVRARNFPNLIACR